MTNLNRFKFALIQQTLSFIFVAALVALPAFAAEPEMKILGEHTNAVLVTVTSHVTKDRDSGLYEYAYEVTSSTASVRPVALIALDLGTPIPPASLNWF